MFTPDLNLEVVQRCRSFRILDQTGVDTGNQTGWNGTGGLDPATLTSAVISIINPAGTTVDNNVLSQIPNPVIGTFYFTDIPGTYLDGLYNLVYKLQTTDYTVTAYTDYATTVSNTVKATATGHGMVTGQYTTLTGTTNYNGWYYVTRIDDNSFYFTKTFVADDGASTGTIGYQSTFYPYVFCRAEAGIDTMYANIARMVDGEVRNNYQDEADTARGLLRALKSAISSSNTTALANILASINQILAFNEIEVNF